MKRVKGVFMKKLLSIMIAMALLLSLAGCGSSANEEKVPESTDAPETEVEEKPEEKNDAETIPDDMTERTVADSFRFLVPKDWAQQEDGSYVVNNGEVYVYFFGIPRELDGKKYLEGVSVEDESFPEEFTEHLNRFELYGSDYEFAYSDAETASWHNVQESGKGMHYRRFYYWAVEKATGNKPATVLADVYDWNDEKYFVIFLESDSISSMNECIRTITATIEKIG